MDLGTDSVAWSAVLDVIELNDTASNYGAPVQYGYTDEHGNSGFSDFYPVASNPFTLSSPALATNISIDCKTPAGTIQAALYDDLAGVPNNLLASGISATLVAGWNEISFASPVYLPAGTYWATFKTTDVSNTLRFGHRRLPPALFIHILILGVIQEAIWPSAATATESFVDIVTTVEPITTGWTGTIIDGLFGTFAANEDFDTAAFTGLADAFGTFVRTEDDDAGVFSGASFWDAALSSIEVNDAAVLAGLASAFGTLVSTEVNDTSLFAGGIYSTGTIVSTEDGDAAVLAGLAAAFGTLVSTEVNDVASIAGGIYATGTLSVIEVDDTSVISGLSAATGTLAVTEVNDASVIAGGIYATGTLAVTEVNDASVLTGLAAAFGTLVSTEVNDAFVGLGAAFWMPRSPVSKIMTRRFLLEPRRPTEHWLSMK